MKLLLVLLVLMSCTKQEPVTSTPHIVTKPKNVLMVSGCYRNIDNNGDHFLRIEKKYDDYTFKVTIIQNLEYSEKILTLLPSDYFEYNCEAFSDMKTLATPSYTNIQKALKDCIPNE